MDKTINIGIAGLGTVGCGVIKNLIRNKAVSYTHLRAHET